MRFAQGKKEAQRAARPNRSPLLTTAATAPIQSRSARARSGRCGMDGCIHRRTFRGRVLLRGEEAVRRCRRRRHHLRGGGGVPRRGRQDDTLNVAAVVVVPPSLGGRA